MLATERPRGPASTRILDLTLRFLGAGPIVILVILCVVIAVLQPVFLSTVNLQNVLLQSSVVAMLAIGSLVVILTGGIDLSVGSTMALATVIGWEVFQVVGDDGGLLVVAAMIVLGLIVGIANGTYYQAPDCVMDPRGPRPAGPPILIGADGPRMLHLTARFADMWNAHYLGDPSRLPEQRQRLDDACLEVGRDPATIETTVGEWITFDDLAPSPDPKVNAVTGSVGAVVDMIGRYEELGVGHLQLQCINPGYDTALERLGAALAEHRRG